MPREPERSSGQEGSMQITTYFAKLAERDVPESGLPGVTAGGFLETGGGLVLLGDGCGGSLLLASCSFRAAIYMDTG